MEKILAACGNDCAACPRYTKHPYQKTEEQLRHTAELWMKIGYRDRIVSNQEIACTGCTAENACRFHTVRCCKEHTVSSCAFCPEYPCPLIHECFQITVSFEPECRKVCTREEYEQIRTAFFEKKENLENLRKRSEGSEG